MNIFYAAYILVTSILFVTCFPFFWLYTVITGKYKKGLRERLGYYHPEIPGSLKGSSRVWIHAVSLGEIRVAESIIKSLKKAVPECSIILSTTTEHAGEFAKRIFEGSIPVIYAPVDVIPLVRKALVRIRPHVMVFLETEIWPVWITETRRMGIGTALVNGRISPGSFKKYYRFRYLFRNVLKNIDRFSMITEKDGARIKAIGADPYGITIGGNAKYDLLTELADPGIIGGIRRLFNLEISSRVFIGGSTRTGEETMIIEAYKKIIREFPDTVLFLAPRHIERANGIASMIEKNGLKYQFRSKIDGEDARRDENIVIIDTFGELFKLYSICSIAFCGASLVPLGGQNPLEPAIWGNAVLHGPYMYNFLDAKALLDEKKAGIEVSSTEMLAEKVLDLLRDPGLLKKQGAVAREAALSNKKSGERHARVIGELLNKQQYVD